MSALAGLWRYGGAPDSVSGPAACAAMLEAQAIYGPDARDLCDVGEIVVGRNLFNLLPEDAHDRQPVRDGSAVLVADLRLDNRDELCAALGVDAAAAAEAADSTLLLKAWVRWGEDVFDHLLGDYAFALWDADGRRLVLARDPLGGRPLHYHRGDGVFAFASMPSGLHALGVPVAADEVFVAEFLALLPERGPRTFFDGLRRVEPAQVVTVTAEGLTARRHWDPLRSPPPAWSGDDPVAALRGELDRAVRVRLRGAPGRVGAHLSGGLDSGAVAATAAGLLGRDGKRLVAFTSVPHAGFEAPELRTVFADEREHAAATAALSPNIDHVLVAAPLDGVVEQFDLTLDAYQRPFRNPANTLWWNAINAEARRRGLRIMLTGEMGNAALTFAGKAYLAECVASGRWRDLFRAARALRARGAGWRSLAIALFGPWAPDWLWAGAFRLKGQTVDMARHSTLNPRMAEDIDMAARARALGHDFLYRPRKGGLASRCDLFIHADPGVYRKGALGLHGIDQRDPTADRRLVELCLSFPTALSFGDGEGRALARRALADRLPPLVVEERRKGTQSADRRDRLRAATDAFRALLADLRLSPSARRVVNLDRLQTMVETPFEGDRATEAAEDSAMLRGLVVARFLRRLD